MQSGPLHLGTYRPADAAGGVSLPQHDSWGKTVAKNERMAQLIETSSCIRYCMKAGRNSDGSSVLGKVTCDWLKQAQSLYNITAMRAFYESGRPMAYQNTMLPEGWDYCNIYQ